MSTLLRWGKFNLVGGMGMLFQLVLVSVLNRIFGGHYLYATVVALELTLLHNFVWHLHYTWRDHRDNNSVFSQLLKFYLSNGLVSLVGNLAVMRILVTQVHLPVLISNGIAILCCSVANFYLGSNWAFAPRRREPLT